MIVQDPMQNAQKTKNGQNATIVAACFTALAERKRKSSEEEVPSAELCLHIAEPEFTEFAACWDSGI